MLNQNTIAASIIFDSSVNYDFYKNIIKRYDIILDRRVDLYSIENSVDIINSDFVFIDISHKPIVKKLKYLNIKSNTKIIVVSSFTQNFIKIPLEIKTDLYHYFTKPLKVELLKKSLESLLYQIKRYKFLENKESILMDLVDKSPFCMAVYNVQGNLIYANKSYVNVENLDFVSKKRNFNSISSCKLNFKEIVHNLKKVNTLKQEYESIKHNYVSYFYFIESQNYIVDISFDISKQIRDIQELKKSAFFFEESSEGVVITDENGNILTVNSAFCKITGYTKDEVIGQSTSILSSGIHDKNFYENLWDNLKYHGKWQGEVWNKRKNGEIYPEWLSITKINSEDDEVNYMALFTDISSIKEADKKLHFYAKHDHLTGLLNKVQFEVMLNNCINRAKRNGNMFALMFIDLDKFKEINDSHGHDVGDIVLKTIASRIQKVLRKEDVVSRIGGDEFNVLIDNIKDFDDAILIGQKINDEVKKEVKVENKGFFLSLSIGISVFPEHGQNSSELIKNADATMYEVKNSGRNGVMIYNYEFTRVLERKLGLQSSLKNAIKNDDFQLYYQPIICFKTDRIVGAEALIRWYDKESKGFVPPDVFIPFAEENGLIDAVGEFVVKKAFEDLMILLNSFGKEFKLSINVSSKEFFSENYIENFLQKCEDFTIKPSNIELEITETHIMKNHSDAIKKFELLKKSGYSLAIDDFGTGYSSLAYLKLFPIDKLKIDKSFVQDLLDDNDDRNIVETIVSMSKNFNFLVQAEGVESKEHENILKELACDMAQGYFYSKPLPLEEFLLLKGEYYE
ncbi:MAG: putative bifunctional diguanylate cyclase/phosphodiesterase [Campylobacterota bacterium]